jgi:acetyl/propionyl-CoA carboxylase alpha subunit
MISKVSAWAPDRAGAIARMRRALHEYQITGITTVIPALLWVLEQDRFMDGAFDTSFLDGVLAARAGESFSELTEEQTDIAVVAAAMHAYLSVPQTTATTAAASPWRHAARLEGVGQ